MDHTHSPRSIHASLDSGGVPSQMGTASVRLELNGELDPGVIRPVDGEDYLGVVMPMRI